MRLTKPRRPGLWLLKLLPALLLLAPLLSLALRAQEESNAKAIVAAAVDTELNADRTDHTAFQYLDHDVTPDHDTVFLVVETPQGSLKRKIEDHGRPLSPGQRQADDQRLQNFLSNRGLQQKEKRDSAHDDAQAEALLKLLPVAFLWTMRGETPSAITLAYKPDPSFHPPTMEAKVLGAMTGEIVVARPSNRIEDIRGKLMNDVKIAFGPMVLARLRAGGTFNVERREVGLGHWQITQSHVHIDGKALLFKNIGEQEDETKTGFKPSPSLTLAEADKVLQQEADKESAGN